MDDDTLPMFPNDGLVVRFEVGDKVTAQTIWGDEVCVVTDIGESLLLLCTENGDRISLAPNRCHLLPKEAGCSRWSFGACDCPRRCDQNKEN